MKKINNAYVSYGDYYADFDTKTGELTLGFGKISLKGSLAIPADSNCEIEYKLGNTCFDKSVTYKTEKGDMLISLHADLDGVSISTKPASALEAVFDFGDDSDLIAMRLEKKSSVINCVLGRGVMAGDNVVFDKNTDTAAHIESDSVFIGFDAEKKAYTASGKGGLKFSVINNVYENKYRVPYGKMNKNNTFGALPPVGWMTWYAVKFDAGEKTVTANTRFQQEHLKDFGANTVWVDWEWYHKGFDEDSFRDDGVDTFNVDKTRYPNGLKPVSDMIRSCGFIPSLWIGYTNETFYNDYMKKHPEVVLAEENSWVGTFFYDITHPTYLNDYLPKALRQVDDWGYEAVKFDTLPICMERTEQYHERLYDKSLTTYRAFRNMIAKTREILGRDRYLLACSGNNQSDVIWANDLFDAARIGLDIFSWQDFIDNCVYRTMEFYPFHNIQLYNDPDNVVVREEFNTMNQAISRAVFVSMLGMPVTFGDDLTQLPPERVDILKRVIPSLDITPKDITARVDKPEVLVTNLKIAKDWEDYNVVSLFNTTETDKTYYFDLERDAELCGGEYHIYDFWQDKFSGCIKGGISIKLEPCQTAVLAVRKAKGVPQIVSTNRHITQGAAEIADVRFENNCLTVRADVVKGDKYTVAVHLPNGYSVSDSGVFECRVEGNMAYLSVMPGKTECMEFTVRFDR